MTKEKINLSKEINVDTILENLSKKYSKENINLIDGLKIDFKESWVHLRKSNTEAIIRIYSEAKTLKESEKLVDLIKKDIYLLTNQ